MNQDKLASVAPAWWTLRPALWRRLRALRVAWPGSGMPSLLVLMLLALSAVAPLASCGGGGVGEGGTGYTSGPITGFGSVIVNGITFEDGSASVEDGDGTMRPRADLRLGMTVEISSDGIRNAGARAARVRFDSAIVGPVESVQGDGFVVLGQRVMLDDTTVFDAALARGLPDIAAGQVVEVYGLFDAGAQRFRATRVERRLVALRYRLRGLVTNLDEGTHTLRIGTAFFAYGSALSVPSDLAIGSFVRVVLATDTDPFGRWPVQRFLESQQALADLESVSLKGYITSFTTPANLRVDGRPVDASTATVSGGPLALGQRVEVSGTPRAAVLQASSVVVRTDADERQRGFELRGAIESLAADRTSLVLRGITVGLTRPGLQFKDGTAANLAVGRQVDVQGVVAVGDGTRLDALVVQFR
jgi:Domain of unknown function (DUF5666)